MAAVAVAPPSSTVLVLGPTGSGKTTLINLLARKVVRAPNSDFIPHAVQDLEIKECIVPYQGHRFHFYVRFLECPGLSGDASADSVALNVCWGTFVAVADICASILVVVPFTDQLNLSLDVYLNRLLPFFKMCMGKKVTFVITKVDTVAQYNKAMDIIGPSIMSWIGSRLSSIPFLGDYLAIGTGSIQLKALRPRIERTLVTLGTALQVIPPLPAGAGSTAPRKHARVETVVVEADEVVPPVAKAHRQSIPDANQNQMDT